MSAVYELAVYGLPWWAQAMLALLPVVAVVAANLKRVLGLRAALQVGGALLAVLAVITGRQQARQQGWKERGESDATAARKRADEREQIQADVHGTSDADLDRRLARWVRDE